MNRSYPGGWWSVASGAGKEAFLADVKKFPTDAQASIVAVMQRYAAGRTTRNEVNAWGDGMRELRKKVDGCWYRVIFVEQPPKLVAVAAFMKKSNQTPRKFASLARKRKPDAGSTDLVRLDLTKLLDDLGP